MQVVLSAVGFVLVDLVLFNDIALKNIQLIDHTGASDPASCLRLDRLG